MRGKLLLLLGIALAGCGSSAGGSSSTQAGTATPASSTSAAGSTTATTTTTTTTSTSATSGSICTAAHLAGSYLGQQGATGHGELGFVLRNTGSAPCRSFGYPGVAFLDRSGHALPTHSTRTTHDFFGRTHLAELVIDPGASVSFRLGVTHGAVPNEPCTTASALQVIPPNDTATLRIRIPGGAFECVTATVSPLQAGNSAYP